MTNGPAARVRAGWSTPMLHVAAIERSIRFYEQLGFEVIDTDRCEPLGWARLHVEGGAIMLLRTEEPVDPAVQGVLLYLYTPDLAALRHQLVAAGTAVPAILHPDYMPSGELRLRDPDGYGVLVARWGEEEHTAWLRRISETGAGGDA